MLFFLGIVLLSVLTACAAPPTPTLRMRAEATFFPADAEVTNLNDFPWYGLVITLNEEYSNRLLMDRRNWPFWRSDRAVIPGEVRYIYFRGNFVYSADERLDSSDTFWEIRYTTPVDVLHLEAKSRIDGPYDLKVSVQKDVIK